MYKRVDLSHVQRKFILIVRDYLTKNKLTQKELAHKIQLDQGHLSSLLAGKRKLSAYYLTKFIRGGVMKVEEIYDGTSKSKMEEEFWKSATELQNFKLLATVVRAREMGIDVEMLLNFAIHSKGE